MASASIYNVEDFLEMVLKMDYKNVEEMGPKLEKLVASPNLNLLPPLELEQAQVTTLTEFPRYIQMPPGVEVPKDSRLDRQTISATVNLSRLTDMLLLPSNISWGIVTRPDRKLAYQFLSFRRILQFQPPIQEYLNSNMQSPSSPRITITGTPPPESTLTLPDEY